MQESTWSQHLLVRHISQRLSYRWAGDGVAHQARAPDVVAILVLVRRAVEDIAHHLPALSTGGIRHVERSLAEKHARDAQALAAAGAERKKKRKRPALPTEYICPITQEPMVDPVSTSDGHTYERSASKSSRDSNLQLPRTKRPSAPSRLLLVPAPLCWQSLAGWPRRRRLR